MLQGFDDLTDFLNVFVFDMISSPAVKGFMIDIICRQLLFSVVEISVNSGNPGSVDVFDSVRPRVCVM